MSLRMTESRKCQKQKGERGEQLDAPALSIDSPSPSSRVKLGRGGREHLNVQIVSITNVALSGTNSTWPPDKQEHPVTGHNTDWGQNGDLGQNAD